MGVRVSVIIPTSGRTELLKRCLTALCTQDFDRSQYEIIVADDAGSPETKRLVKGMDVNGTSLRYVPVTGNHGPAAARNTGLRHSRGEIVAFTDDDCIPSPEWLKAGTAAFVDGIVGASGKIVVPLPERPSDYELNASRLEFSQFVTANCFYRKPALMKIGGFDERFRIAWREDSDLFFRLLKGQNRLTEAPDAIVVHPVRPAPWGISISQQKKNVFNALLYKKHRRFYRERLKPVFPWHYYAIVLALIVSVVSLVTGHRDLSLGAFAFWFVATLFFCLHRLKRSSRAPKHVLEMAVTSLVIPPVCIFWRLVGAVRYRVFFL